MGYLRFYRRKQIAPGVRVNLSKSGPSLSVGRRGAWYTVGPRGRRTTVGLPGTGLWYTSQQRWSSGRSAAANAPASGVPPLIALPFTLCYLLFWLVAFLGAVILVIGMSAGNHARGLVRR